MIRIDKGPAPPTLVKKGGELRKLNEEKFDIHPDEYSNGTRAFDFGTAYKTKNVVQTLSQIQHNKCCFSEAKFEGDYPHVEHYRPKGRITNYETNEPQYPGYYWLAYEWSNLFLCKAIINSTFKRDYFPIYNELERNRNHNNKFTEHPILIDPSVEEPRDHIRFHLDEPMGITERGKMNIIILGLRHSSLVEARMKLFTLIKTLSDLVRLYVSNGMDINAPEYEEARNALTKATKPFEPFSSMAIDFLSA